jgi:hypothetical protein
MLESCVFFSDTSSLENECKIANLIVAKFTMEQLANGDLTENERNDLIIQYFMLTQCKIQ